MKFGPIPTRNAEGAILAHSAQLPGGAIKKGRSLTRDDIDRLAGHGIEQIIAAVLDADDVPEDQAAARIAKGIAGNGLQVAEAFTGRVNIFAERDGLALIDADRLVALNRLDEGLTVATLKPYDRVNAGQMIATVKIIPFALPERVVAAAEKMIAGHPGPMVAAAPFQHHKAHLILTELPGTKPSVIAKRHQAIAKRLESAGSELAGTVTVAHETAAISKAIGDATNTTADPILVFGASAIVDRKDVIPAGIEDAGGNVQRLGMPVDPGNLLLYGTLGGKTVIGVPSCASSPKVNGLDWVLERALAKLPITGDDISAMAVGGLLMEIQSRPQPRQTTGVPTERKSPRIAAVVLAAGRSTRMGERNKLLEQLGGRSLVRHAVDAAARSRAATILVVTGHEAEAVRQELADTEVAFTHNPEYAEGLATSLAKGIAALPDDVDGAVVLLGDMPGITAQTVDRLIAAFSPDDGRGICLPVFEGRRGNPVLWAKRYFNEIKALGGDTGAKGLLGLHAEDVAEVAFETDAILRDIDTPNALERARASES